jgi:hypothetical protein
MALALKKKEWVPHFVALPSPMLNIRSKYGIPRDATLGVRIGGFSTFDVKFAHEAVKEVLEQRSDYWFIFVNTENFISHPRVFYIDQIYGDQEKVDFLSSATFMLHARTNGESFGLAILEAMLLGVPVLSWKGGLDRNHTQLLTKESLYGNKKELVKKMLTINKYGAIESNRSTASIYGPDNVMEKFCSVFEIH